MKFWQNKSVQLVAKNVHLKINFPPNARPSFSVETEKKQAPVGSSLLSRMEVCHHSRLAKNCLSKS